MCLFLLAFSIPALAQTEPRGEGEMIEIGAPDADGDEEADAPGYDPELDEAARLTFVRAREAFDAGEYEDARSGAFGRPTN